MMTKMSFKELEHISNALEQTLAKAQDAILHADETLMRARKIIASRDLPSSASAAHVFSKAVISDTVRSAKAREEVPLLPVLTYPRYISPIRWRSMAQRTEVDLEKYTRVKSRGDTASVGQLKASKSLRTHQANSSSASPKRQRTRNVRSPSYLKSKRGLTRSTKQSARKTTRKLAKRRKTQSKKS